MKMLVAFFIVFSILNVESKYFLVETDDTDSEENGMKMSEDDASEGKDYRTGNDYGALDYSLGPESLSKADSTRIVDRITRIW